MTRCRSIVQPTALALRVGKWNEPRKSISWLDGKEKKVAINSFCPEKRHKFRSFCSAQMERKEVCGKKNPIKLFSTMKSHFAASRTSHVWMKWNKECTKRVFPCNRRRPLAGHSTAPQDQCTIAYIGDVSLWVDPSETSRISVKTKFGLGCVVSISMHNTANADRAFCQRKRCEYSFFYLYFSIQFTIVVIRVNVRALLISLTRCARLKSSALKPTRRFYA